MSSESIKQKRGETNDSVDDRHNDNQAGEAR